MRELKDTAVLLLGFLPWLLFLFFSGHSMESLERITWISLAVGVVFTTLFKRRKRLQREQQAQ